jgi:hypothetical protein
MAVIALIIGSQAYWPINKKLKERRMGSALQRQTNAPLGKTGQAASETPSALHKKYETSWARKPGPQIAKTAAEVKRTNEIVEFMFIQRSAEKPGSKRRQLNGFEEREAKAPQSGVVG